MVVPGIVRVIATSRTTRTSSRLSVPDTANAQYAFLRIDPGGA